MSAFCAYDISEARTCREHILRPGLAKLMFVQKEQNLKTFDNFSMPLYPYRSGKFTVCTLYCTCQRLSGSNRNRDCRSDGRPSERDIARLYSALFLFRKSSYYRTPKRLQYRLNSRVTLGSTKIKVSDDMCMFLASSSSSAVYLFVSPKRAGWLEFYDSEHYASERPKVWRPLSSFSMAVWSTHLRTQGPTGGLRATLWGACLKRNSGTLKSRIWVSN